MTQISQQLEQLAAATETRLAADLNRMAGKLQAHLQYSQLEDVIEVGPAAFLGEVLSACDQIHEALYDTYINYPAEEAFA